MRPTSFQVVPSYIKEVENRIYFWRWYIYFSPDGTPSRRLWGLGPGLKGR